MEYLKDPLILGIFLSFIVEFFTSRTFDLIKPFLKLNFKNINFKNIDENNLEIINKHFQLYFKEFKKNWGPYISVVWGIILAFITRLQFLLALKVIESPKLYVIDIILSGIIISKGSNFLHDLRKLLQRNQ